MRILITLLIFSFSYAQTNSGWINNQFDLTSQRAEAISINGTVYMPVSSSGSMIPGCSNPFCSGGTNNNGLGQILGGGFGALNNFGGMGGIHLPGKLGQILGILQIANTILNMVQTMFGGQQIANNAGNQLNQNPFVPPQTNTQNQPINCSNLNNANAAGLNVKTPDGQIAANPMVNVSNPKGIIVHSSTVNSGLQGAKNPDYRYNYGVDRQGNVFLLQPNGYTQHIKPGDAIERTGRTDLSNRNTISITLLDTDNDKDGTNRYDPSIPHKTVPSTSAQLNSATNLIASLKKQYPSIQDVYGHGELQNDREAKEGIDVASTARQFIKC